MIETEYIQLKNKDKILIKKEIDKCKKILDIKYRKFLVLFFIIIEILILYVIYLFEDYGFSIILKFLIIVPIWMISMITFLYFQKRMPAKRIFKTYNKILKAEQYAALRLKTKQCEKHTEGNFDYFLFDIENKRKVLLRLQDFDIEGDNFPTESFIIPPSKLFNIVGKTIITKGNTINPIEKKDSKIPSYLQTLNLLERGQVLILKNN